MARSRIHWRSVPGDFDDLHLVLLLLPLIPGDQAHSRQIYVMLILLCNDDEVCVGALIDLFDGIVENPFHVDLPQWLDD